MADHDGFNQQLQMFEAELFNLSYRAKRELNAAIFEAAPLNEKIELLKKFKEIDDVHNFLKTEFEEQFKEIASASDPKPKS